MDGPRNGVDHARSMQLSSSPGPEPITELLRRWQAGDEAALGSLLVRELPWIRRMAERRLQGPLRARLDASDCVQDAVADFLRYGPRVVPSDHHQLRGLLARIVENNLRDRDDWYRARRRDAAREQPLASATGLVLDAAVDQPTTPSAAADREEQRAWVRLALELLDPDDRRIVIRRDWDRASFAEIGSELQLGENAARMRWVRAVGRLADQLVELRSGRLGRELRAESVAEAQHAG